jgi:hypothetical protein
MTSATKVRVETCGMTWDWADEIRERFYRDEQFAAPARRLEATDRAYRGVDVGLVDAEHAEARV